MRRRTESADKTDPTATFWCENTPIFVHHMDNSSDDPSARADRLLKRNAAKDARDLEVRLNEDARTSATMAESDLRTVADYTSSSSTMVTRKPEVKSDTDEKRPHTSSDYLFTLSLIHI